jgi:L-fuculose-phosphate aldolase
VASVPLDQLQLPEMLVLLGAVALVPYATPGSDALARQLERFLPDHDAFLLENHGALTVGRSARQAALRMELIEQNARISLTIRHLGKPFALALEEREVLMGFRRRMAMWACENPDEQKP